jgi:hypothetical protein
MKKTTKAKAPAPAKTEAKAPKKTAAAPAVKKAGAKAVVTTISAQIDVGFGNALYVRGEGPGLSWEKGALMTCVADDLWSIELANATKPIVCKFLLNDLVWCSGEDFVVPMNRSASFVPIF